MWGEMGRSYRALHPPARRRRSRETARAARERAKPCGSLAASSSHRPELRSKAHVSPRAANTSSPPCSQLFSSQLLSSQGRVPPLPAPRSRPQPAAGEEEAPPGGGVVVVGRGVEGARRRRRPEDVRRAAPADGDRGGRYAACFAREGGVPEGEEAKVEERGDGAVVPAEQGERVVARGLAAREQSQGVVKASHRRISLDVIWRRGGQPGPLLRRVRQRAEEPGLAVAVARRAEAPVQDCPLLVAAPQHAPAARVAVEASRRRAASAELNLILSNRMRFVPF